jgi:hypothetical protein
MMSCQTRSGFYTELGATDRPAGFVHLKSGKAVGKVIVEVAP